MTITDIAAALGVSKASVSRAITGKGRISPQTRERILNYIETHNFKPNVIAQSLANMKTYNVAFTIPGQQEFVEMPFFQECLIGVCDQASAGGYDVLVTMVDESDLSRMHRAVENRKVDGVILSRNVDNDGMIDYLRRQNMPFVLMGTFDGHEVVTVDHDHAAACREMTSLFIGRARDKIGLICGNHRHVVNQNRYKGFQEAAGGLVDAIVVWDAADSASILRAFETMTENGIRTILAMDDMICNHILRHAHTLGMRIPQDVDLASFYGSWYLETHLPPIPSLHFDSRALGSAACDLLLRMLSGEPVPVKTLIGYKLLYM